jgi:hypothetical protein
MARKPIGRRITRRDAVMLIGAGAVVGPSRREAAAAGVARQPDPSCKYPANVREIRRNGPSPHTRTLLVDGCCDATRNAVLVGVQNPGATPRPATKTHLAPLEERLEREKLAEYVFMIWGLTASEVKTLQKEIPAKLFPPTGERK